MNQPGRVLAQRAFVAPLMRRLGGSVAGSTVLEVGCGRGVGVEILVKRFGAGHVHAFDLDETMLDLARRRLRGLPPDRFDLSVGDVTHMDFPDASFDAVFDFGAIHLVEDWHAAMSEVRRVLRPGGRFCFEEIAGRFLRSTLRWFTDRSADPRRTGFTAEAFLAELDRLGMPAGSRVRRPRLLSLTGTVGDLIGVARVTG
jgi:ubiquinone/menaquinone biosynthesis C-methylase UbiE